MHMMMAVPVLAVLVFSAFAYVGQIPDEAERISVCFSGTCITAEVADTPTERQRGLMFREHLDENEGMLFAFEYDGYHSFWMKNTYLPLDIIWVDNNFSIVHVEQAQPCDSLACEYYIPSAPARYVIETGTGFTEMNGIGMGDAVSFSLGQG